ncbi:uncharacterized protein LOC126387065 isoform X3 [Epinephelus moara]|uniref:uncharacterized protein LOC126387065 isoform X3 n=1 Tax=Epinephelus moara TaxID=300413 RepID=UPI00214F20B2|nr:uncharacterized protein LOC126387065 isoform X3 [Epinephelus moara]
MGSADPGRETAASAQPALHLLRWGGPFLGSVSRGAKRPGSSVGEGALVSQTTTSTTSPGRLQVKGYVVEMGQLRPDPAKIKAVEEWPVPATPRNWRLLSLRSWPSSIELAKSGGKPEPLWRGWRSGTGGLHIVIAHRLQNTRSGNRFGCRHGTSLSRRIPEKWPPGSSDPTRCSGSSIPVPSE